ncbi:probable protocatechuate 3,4-dioxygenase beta subunit [Phialocephala subalpina]|uniref:Probable protocatechuate 3,4-dioxygenase beta subunit n=1 Tax=Phialocephala subalpina TaxID=576137 RepID=A0A1L7X9G7_9HELO|nr:probable protocatechuate 3,4-dioxygenase beta subunit [Phialocephala subalpina]
MHFSPLLLSFLLAPAAVLAHPGHHETLSVKEHIRRAGLSKRCEGSAAAMNKKRWIRHNERRSLASRSNTTVVITTEAPYYETIQNDTCVLTPEVTSGPYVWPRSQTLRQDMSEDQPGVPLYLDIGVLDTNTCEPLEAVLVDLWHCNATGSYSSFEGRSPNTPFAELVASLNMTIGPGLDLHTGDTTWLRGMWPTDSNGMMEMKTVFPGFYVERTIHIHAQVHTNWVIGANGTVVSDNTISTGQIFFAEDLSEQIMALEPYVSHTQINRTTNAVDSVYASENTAGFNPVMTVVPLDGEDVTNGMVAYITLGVAA